MFSVCSLFQFLILLVFCVVRRHTNYKGTVWHTKFILVFSFDFFSLTSNLCLIFGLLIQTVQSVCRVHWIFHCCWNWVDFNSVRFFFNQSEYGHCDIKLWQNELKDPVEQQATIMMCYQERLVTILYCFIWLIFCLLARCASNAIFLFSYRIYRFVGASIDGLNHFQNGTCKCFDWAIMDALTQFLFNRDISLRKVDFCDCFKGLSVITTIFVSLSLRRDEANGMVFGLFIGKKFLCFWYLIEFSVVFD